MFNNGRGFFENARLDKNITKKRTLLLLMDLLKRRSSQEDYVRIEETGIERHILKRNLKGELSGQGMAFIYRMTYRMTTHYELEVSMKRMTKNAGIDSNDGVSPWMSADAHKVKIEVTLIMHLAFACARRRSKSKGFGSRDQLGPYYH
jgi:hypothetical protein